MYIGAEAFAEGMFIPTVEITNARKKMIFFDLNVSPI